LATAVDRKTGLLPIQVATENEHSHFIVHNLLKRDMPVDTKEKVRAQLVPHHYSWNHIVANTEDLYHQVVTKVLQSCTQPQVLALAHVEGPDGKIALAAATPVCKHEIRVMLRLFNTLEVVNQRPAYTNPVSDTQIFYALRYDPPKDSSGQFTVIHEDKGGDNDHIEDWDDTSQVSAVSRNSIRSTLTSRSQQNIEDKLRVIRKEKGQQVIAKLTSRADVVERELKVRKEYHLSRHYVPAIISVHHTVQHAAYSEAMAEPGYCITMEGADTTAENLMLDMRKQGKPFPGKALKRIGISLLHMHDHGIIHGDFGTHNIGKFGSRWKLLGVGGSVAIGDPTDPNRGFYHPPEAIVVENKRAAIGKKSVSACIVSITAQPTYDIWAYGVVLFEAIAGVPLSPYACRGKRAMSTVEVGKIGLWDELSVRKALKNVSEDDVVARDLLSQLLHHDPQLRFKSMRAVLEHPFFTGGKLDDRHGRPSDASSMKSSKNNSGPASQHHAPNGSIGQSGYGGQASHLVNQYSSRPDTGEVKEALSDSPVAQENQLNGVAANTASARTRKPGLSETSNNNDSPISPDSAESKKSMRSFGGIRFRRRPQKQT
jgi:serine/threonine protein kinase